jgi:hypothetical protein
MADRLGDRADHQFHRRPRPAASPTAWPRGSIRRECLDHIVTLNAAHLRRVLRTYADYYNDDRTHLGLGKDAPKS